MVRILNLKAYILISTHFEWLQKGQSKMVSTLGLAFATYYLALFFLAILNIIIQTKI